MAALLNQIFVADAYGLSGPSNPQVTAVASTTPGRIEVSWPDYEDETGFRVFETSMSNPPPLMTGNGLNTGWTQSMSLPSNTTSASIIALGSRRFIVCADDVQAVDGIISQCFGPSALVTPAAVLDGASINGLAAVEVRSNSITVAWRNSFSTARSEISISPGGQTVVDDPDERHQFVGLSAGTNFTIRGCAQSQRQLSEGTRSCSQITVATLPAAPNSVDSLGVLQSMDPRSRTIRFTDVNPPARAASSYQVRLFKAGTDTVLQDRTVLSNAGNLTRDVTFEGLEPFTDYEVWVIPLNVSGVGASAGIGFTTPAEVLPRTTPLSGNSALLEFDAAAVGEYTIEHQTTGGTFVALTRVVVTKPGKQRFVIGGIKGPQLIRVRWRLAFLESESRPITVARGQLGAPEIIRGNVGPLLPFGGPLPLRINAQFMPTINDPAGADVSYVLRGEIPGGGFRTIAQRSTPPFAIGDRLSMSTTSQLLLLSPRVCRKSSSKTACSAVLNLGSEGLQRVYITGNTQ